MENPFSPQCFAKVCINLYCAPMVWTGSKENREAEAFGKKPLSRQEEVKKLYLYCLKDSAQVIHS